MVSIALPEFALVAKLLWGQRAAVSALEGVRAGPGEVVFYETWVES